VRDFNGLPNWHPAIAESRIEGGEPADKIGCVRDFTLPQWRPHSRKAARPLGLRHVLHLLDSRIADGVENYVATLRLTPVTDGEKTFLEWSAEFDCAPERETELINTIGAGRVSGRFDALKRVFWRLRRAAIVKSTILDAPTGRGLECAARFQRP